MSFNQRLLIIKDPCSNGKEYLIDQISKRWSQWGHNVVTCFGANHLPPADIAILHVDMTNVPPEYTKNLTSYKTVLNLNAVDISKRSYSRNLVTPDDDFQGPVILKTNRNFGGTPETSRMAYHWAKISNRWNWASTKTINPNNYPIYENKYHVPARAWQNKELIVEKFLPEREKGLFFVRYWIFFGDQGWAGRIGSANPIVKFSRMATTDEAVSVPEELYCIREEMGLDYGRFDFAVHDGKPVVFDINKTIGGADQVDEYEQQLDQLAHGLKSYL